MFEKILWAMFIVLMIANAIVMARHVMMMRVVAVTLTSFIEQQRWFHEFIQQQERQPSIDPE